MDDLLTRSIDEIIPLPELEQALASGRKLRLKLGVDPSSPDIHLGHAVVLRKLRKFQQQGHTVIFLIGDATARIGDPSGKSKTRPVLTVDQVEANAATYLEQVGAILDIKEAEIRRNSEWLDELDFVGLIQLASKFTAAQLVERDDFAKRLAAGDELAMHEFLYPMLVAYDSVMLAADVEFGGSDQRFNLLAGRALQKKMGQRPQQVVMTQLLVGTDGEHKMSKSLGNYIGLSDQPADMYGKVMSIPDALIAPYYELCTDIELATIEELVKTLAGGANPRDAKASLAREIVTLYHGEAAALAAEAAWDKQFRDGGHPDDMPTYKLATPDGLSAIELLVASGLAASNSEARRLVEQHGARLNDQLLNLEALYGIKTGDVLQAGKRRFVRLEV